MLAIERSSLRQSHGLYSHSCTLWTLHHRRSNAKLLLLFVIWHQMKSTSLKLSEPGDCHHYFGFSNHPTFHSYFPLWRAFAIYLYTH